MLSHMSLDMVSSVIEDDVSLQDVTVVTDIGAMLRSLFGPTRWQERASAALRACGRHVRYIARGERPLTARHVAQLQAIAEHRDIALAQERRIAHERVDRLYDAGQKALLQAKIDLAILAKERAKTKRKGASRRRPSPQAPTET